MLGSKYVPNMRGNILIGLGMKKISWSISNFVITRICMAKDPTNYFFKKKVINFDIIHHECRGDPLHGTYKGYKTITDKDIKKYSKPQKQEVMKGIFRNCDRKDIYWLRKK